MEAPSLIHYAPSINHFLCWVPALNTRGKWPCACQGKAQRGFTPKTPPRASPCFTQAHGRCWCCGLCHGRALLSLPQLVGHAPCPHGAAHSHFPSTIPHQQKSPGAAVPPDHFSNPLQCYHCMCCRASATKRVGHARGPDGPSPPPTLAPINLCKPCQQRNLKTSFKKPPALTFKQENLFVSASCFGR